MSMTETKGPRPNVMKAFFKLLPTAFLAEPFLFILCQLVSIAHGFSWGITTLVTQRFFDTAELMARGMADMAAVAMSLLMLGLIYFSNQVLNGVGNFLPQVYGEKALGKIQQGINEKMARISPVCFEDTKMLDDINKANEGKNHAVFFVILVTFVFTFYIPYFLFMGWYLFSLKPILALAIVIVFIPAMTSQVLRSKVYAGLEDKAAPIRRQFEYYEGCIAGREYFKETRLLGAFGFFMRLYRQALELLNKERWKATFKTSMYELLMKVLALAGYLLILFMLFEALMGQEISTGAFTAVFASLGALFEIMEEVVCRHAGNIAQQLGTIQNYLNFLEIPERGGSDTVVDPDCDIRLVDVSFSYPSAESPAVKNASFTIKKGETIAIVGENGSGKTTIVRLITGLYLPDKGYVLHGDKKTSDISLKYLFKNISGVFQKYQKYQLTLGDNISISDTSLVPEEDYLDRVSSMSGLDPKDEAFVNGYDTMLSREFDGVDISGGQWQRVAIARGFYRPHNIIVLDEPTAAIDPLEEKRIYERFARIAKDKTAIIVTHRLGSVRLADRIIVMDKGEVVDIGTHEELIDRCSKYSEMWESQAKYYV
ncbi:MAG TPA: ABC transporter ATP-binding protein [Candidatus Atribacteria bacterium]|nr:ABC transporter ATP-binding protein [Candidatus Atribacteria bacterium]